nr:GntP family permease [uncultured Bacillus sp.]
MEYMGLVGILLAIGLIIYLAAKGYNIIFVAPILSILIIVTNGMDFFPTIIGKEGSYMAGLAGFVINMFAVFLLGSILAKYMEKSGAAQSLAEKVISITGKNNAYAVLIGVFLISTLLTLGGVSLFVLLFVLIPIAKPLFKELNIPWNLISIPTMLGMGTFTMTMLPGTPSVQNVVPTTYLGTTLTAAPVVGIVATIAAIAFGLWYMKFALNRALKKGQTFADFCDDASVSAVRTDIPSFFVSVLPMLVLVGIVVVGSLMKVNNIILIGLIAAILIAGLLFNKYIPKQKEVLNEGATSSITPLFFTASTVAFGVVLAMAPGFDKIKDLILSIPGDPLISLSTASIAIGAITGSCSGAIGIVLEAFADNYLAMGVNAEAMHRVGLIAASLINVMPQSGVVLTFLALTGLTQKNGFKPMFIIMTGANLVALIAAIITAFIIY